MSRPLLTASILAVAVAALASAPQSRAQQAQDPLQKMYDAPLKKLYDDPLRRMYDDPTKRLYGDKTPSIYAPNPLAPGANQAPHTLNDAPAKGATPYAAPGAVSAGNPGGVQPAFDSRFRRFDRNNDGRVSRDEYVTSNMQRAPVNPSTADLQRDSLRRRFDSRFTGADVNRNGSISRDEYDALGNPRF